MKNELKFYHCKACGSILEAIGGHGGALACCGQDMQPLMANVTDAATEKHVPVLKRDGNVLTVEVGSVTHPMSPEHHISWIVAAQDGLTQRASLDPSGAPKAEFVIGEGPVTVYEYCNLHGLWAAEIK